MKRNQALLSFILIIGIETFCLCLIPVSPTHVNSADIAWVLSSSTLGSPLPLQMIHPKDSTHSDDTLAALTIYLEARGESFSGKLAVAAVIRNRMTHKYHSDGTVKGTVLRAKQFEPWMGRNPEEVKFDQTNRIMQESL